MRIFIGIPIEESLREEILQWSDKFQISNNKFQIRFIEPKNLHVTLVPPWEETNVESVIKKLSIMGRHSESRMHLRDEESQIEDKEILHPSAALRVQDDAESVKPFEIRFDKISFGPNIREPRMIWVVGKALDQLEDLKLKIERLLGKIPEDRPFRLHCTLARFRTSPGPLFKKEGETISWRQMVTSFALYQSHLLPQGAEYEVLAEFKFGV